LLTSKGGNGGNAGSGTGGNGGGGSGGMINLCYVNSFNYTGSIVLNGGAFGSGGWVEPLVDPEPICFAALPGFYFHQ